MVKIHEQLVEFDESLGMFGKTASVEMRKKLQPGTFFSNLYCFSDLSFQVLHLLVT